MMTTVDPPAAIGSVVAIASGPVFGWLHDHVSEKLVLTTRSAANVLSSAMYFVFPSFAGVSAATAVDAAGKAAFRPAWGAMMARVAGQDKRSRARTVSWMCMGEDAGGVFGPVLAGLLWTGWGVPAVLGARVVLAIVTEVYTVAFAAPKARPVHAAPPMSAVVPTEGCPS